jgi:broad specificity phosphatase PhoE
LGADIQASYPQLIQQRRESPRFFRAPGDGESLEDVALRVQPALEGILNDEAENIIIVSHHVCLGVIRAILEGQPLDDVYVSQIENGVLYECRWTGTSSGCLEGRKKV